MHVAFFHYSLPLAAAAGFPPPSFCGGRRRSPIRFSSPPPPKGIEKSGWDGRKPKGAKGKCKAVWGEGGEIDSDDDDDDDRSRPRPSLLVPPLFSGTPPAPRDVSPPREKKPRGFCQIF